MTAAVRVRALTVDYAAAHGRVRAVDDVDLDIDEGESFGLVGSSGSGKSTLALALSRYLPRGAEMSARQLEVAGTDVLGLGGQALRRFRRDRLGVVFQEPSQALDPTASIGAQVAEVHLLRGLARRDAWRAGVASLESVGLPDPGALAGRFPHELSGGQQQRVLIAMALTMRPRLLVLDEPTASLDAVSKGEVLALVARLQARRGFASLLISHDLSLVVANCRRIGVLDEGRLVQTLSPEEVAATPVPAARARVRSAGVNGSGEAGAVPPTVVVTGLAKKYGAHLVLDGIDLSIDRGETLGVVGETGSGKTTLGSAIAGLISHAGTVVVNAPAAPPPVQMVFQSPDASLNPRRTIRQTLRRSIQLLHGDTTPEELVDRTGLPRDVLDRQPRELSGGQKQRVAIARAFAGRSPLIVCDEPTSALDPAAQAKILDLLIELQEQTGVSYLFISHDLPVVTSIAHRIAVIRDGCIVETASAAGLLADARHPYSRRLLSAAQDARSREPRR